MNNNINNKLLNKKKDNHLNNSFKNDNNINKVLKKNNSLVMTDYEKILKKRLYNKNYRLNKKIKNINIMEELKKEKEINSNLLLSIEILTKLNNDIMLKIINKNK